MDKSDTLSNTYDVSNVKVNIYLINEILDIMMINPNIKLKFGSFLCFTNTNYLYMVISNNPIIKTQNIQFSISYNNKLISNQISDSDIYYVLYTWLKLNNKHSYDIKNIYYKNVYRDWILNIIKNFD